MQELASVLGDTLGAWVTIPYPSELSKTGRLLVRALLHEASVLGCQVTCVWAPMDRDILRQLITTEFDKEAIVD